MNVHHKSGSKFRYINFALFWILTKKLLMPGRATGSVYKTLPAAVWCQDGTCLWRWNPGRMACLGSPPSEEERRMLPHQQQTLPPSWMVLLGWTIHVACSLNYKWDQYKVPHWGLQNLQPEKMHPKWGSKAQHHWANSRTTEHPNSSILPMIHEVNQEINIAFPKPIIAKGFQSCAFGSWVSAMH